MISYMFYIRDVIFIVTNRFKDKEGNVIRYSVDCLKKDDFFYKGLVVKKEDISDLDFNLLRILTNGNKSFAGCCGIYHFYAGNSSKGLLNLGLYFFSFFICLFAVVFFRPLFVLGILSYMLLWFKIIYDKKIIGKRRYRDSKGKFVCLNYLDVSYLY